MSVSKSYLSGSAKIDAKGNWALRFRLPSGKDSRKVLGPAWTHRGEAPKGYLTERDALRELDKILSKYEGWTSDADPLFKFAGKEFIERCQEKALSGDTIKRYEGILRHHLGHLDLLRLSEIDEEMISNVHEEVAGVLSASTANQIKVVLSGVYKTARKKRGYRGADFSAWFEQQTVQRGLEIDVYSVEEVEAVARVLADGSYRSDPRRKMSEFEKLERPRFDRMLAAMTRTAAFTALRMSELRGLRWRDVDFANSSISVVRGFTNQNGVGLPKSKKRRTVPMARRVAAELDEISRRPMFTGPDDLVFSDGWGHPVAYKSVIVAYHRAQEVAGIRKLRWHDLRHCACCLWIQTFSLYEVQQMAGHANVSTTALYLHYRPRQADAARMDALYDGPDHEKPELKEVEI